MKAQQKIRLAELNEKHAGIGNTHIKNELRLALQDLHDCEQERDELAAHCERLRNFAEDVSGATGYHDGTYQSTVDQYIDISYKELAQQLIEEVPAQSLAAIRADAVKRFVDDSIAEIASEHQMAGVTARVVRHLRKLGDKRIASLHVTTND